MYLLFVGDYRWIPKLACHMQFPSHLACHLCDVPLCMHDHIHNGDNDPWYKEPFRFLSLDQKGIRKRKELAEDSGCEYKDKDCCYRLPEPVAMTNKEATERGEESNASQYSYGNSKHPSKKNGFKSIPSAIVMLNWFLITWMLFDPMHIISNVWKYCFKSMKGI